MPFVLQAQFKRLIAGVVALVFVLSGCASSQEGADEADRPTARETVAPELARDVEDIRTVRLFPTRQQRSTVPIDAQLPIVTLNSDDQLRLSFDLMEPRGRPLSVHFYQTTRSWERRLSPSEFMRGFQRDEVVNYQSAEGTDVRYTHYTYDFPNDGIDFLVSGNYVLRVTEQGDEQAVLFERAFFVTEQEGSTDLAFERFPMVGFNAPGVAPTVRIQPPRELEGRVFDFAACFVRDGQLPGTRCVDRPQLMDQPALRFELDRRQGFEPTGGDFRLDLRALQTTRQIEALDRSRVPMGVRLAPDLARFPDAGGDIPLSGQAVISRVRDVPDPETNGAYVNAQFRFVPPDEERVDGTVALVGAFNNWGRAQEETILAWDAGLGQYVGEALVKQGEYDYRYIRSGDRQLRSLTQGLPPQRASFSAFVYYRDPQLNTDRLISVTDDLIRP